MISAAPALDAPHYEARCYGCRTVSLCHATCCRVTPLRALMPLAAARYHATLRFAMICRRAFLSVILRSMLAATPPACFFFRYYADY